MMRGAHAHIGHNRPEDMEWTLSRWWIKRWRSCASRAMTYRTLQLQFQLDEAHIEALKDELIYGQRVAVEEEGRVLVWTRDEGLGVSPGVLHGAMMRLYADLVSALLQREGRLSYRTLTQLFGFDAACLDHVRQDLVFKQLARDVHAEGLEWTGGLPGKALLEALAG